MITGTSVQRQCATMRPALLAACFLIAVHAAAQDAIDILTGHDVGDGNAPYNAPYDPADVTEMGFIAPTVDHPYYEILVPMGDWTGGSHATVQEVRVNGLRCESFYTFVDGFSHVHQPWITHEAATAKNVLLVARMLWHNGADTAVDVRIGHRDAEGKGTTTTQTYRASAPAQGGGPEGWRRYQTVVLRERAGIARQNEPVECSIAARAENAGDLGRELRVYEIDGGTLGPEMPLQVFNQRAFPGAPPGTAEENYLQHPSKAVDALFLAHVPAHGAKVYALFYDHPSAPERTPPETDLTVTGPDLGAVVRNGHYTVTLSEKSGQIAAFQLNERDGKAAPLLTNSYSAAAHWNPDSFSSNGKWGHTFAWDPPEHTVVTARGPLLFRITNRGRMPDYTPQVYVSVSYSFYAYQPYVKVSTVMEVRDPLDASAIRNGEIVLDSHLVTHFVWQEKSGELHKAGTLHGPTWQDEWTARVDQDVPWIAMTHELDGYGLGAVVINSIAFNPVAGEAVQHRPAYYLYYHHMWALPLTYFTRAWVYPFSDYQRGPIVPVEPGSTYVNRSAFVPFFLNETGPRYGVIQEVSGQLSRPLEQRWGR